MSKTEPHAVMKPVQRTSAGLRDALFDEIDGMRAGTSNPTRANAISRLTSGVVEIVHMEMEVERFIGQTTRRVEAQMLPAGMPKPVTLGASA